jgi:hypothetical protein
VQTFVHDVKSIVADLHSRIEDLEEKQGQIRSALEGGVGVETNSAALQQITKSLLAVQIAKKALEEGCCDQGCNINYLVG